MSLDTKIIKENGDIKIILYRKSTKLPVLWSSNIPKRYKQNAIDTDLYRSKQISRNFNKEIF